MRTSRLEAFSDGVFAIAITLLVLEIKQPAGDKPLARALLDQWPSYLAYVVSFLTIGIIWVNHHALFDRVAHADRTLLFTNLLLLMVVSFIPFPTGIVAEHLRSGADEDVAVALYAATFLVMGIGFYANSHHARRARLFRDGLTEAEERAIVIRNMIGQGGYVLAIALAFVSATAGLVLCGIVAVYYVLPGRAVPAPT
ncbi:MAG TPA: TMEM175 family protein [Solirubrobacteraceae bacterium]